MGSVTARPLFNRIAFPCLHLEPPLLLAHAILFGRSLLKRFERTAAPNLLAARITRRVVCLGRLPRGGHSMTAPRLWVGLAVATHLEHHLTICSRT